MPIEVTIRLQLDEPDVFEALQNFNVFGAPVMVEDPDGDRIEFTANLPGGLGGVFHGGRVFLGPNRSDNDQPYRLRLQILDGDDGEISTCRLDMEPVTRGVSGSGVRAVGVEDQGVFTLEMRIDPVAQQVNISLTSKDLTGKHPDDVLPGLRVAAAFHPPNKWRFASPYGPIEHPGDPIPGTLDIGAGDVLPLVEALAIIQEHTTDQITIPDLRTLSRSDSDELISAARLLQEGSLVSEWHDVIVDEGMAGVSTQAGSESGTTSFQWPFAVRINGRDVMLGSIRYELASARVEPAPASEDGVVRVRLIPEEDRTVTLVYQPPSSR